MSTIRPADISENFLYGTELLPHTPKAQWTNEQKVIILHLQKCSTATLFTCGGESNRKSRKAKAYLDRGEMLGGTAHKRGNRVVEK